MTRDSRTLMLLLFTFAILTAILIDSGMPLRTDAAPLGIVSFQLAGSGNTAHTILDSWQDTGRNAALINLAVDYPYLVIYAALLSLLCRRAAASLARYAAVGRTCARGAWVAAGCDAIENLALLAQLLNAPGDGAALVALAFASVKFALLGVILAYLLVSLFARFSNRFTQT